MVNNSYDDDGIEDALGEGIECEYTDWFMDEAKEFPLKERGKEHFMEILKKCRDGDTNFDCYTGLVPQCM